MLTKQYSLDWTAPVHVVLLAAFPVLFLYAYNIAEMDFKQVLLPLAFSLAGAILLRFILTLVLRDRRKAGLAVAIFLLLFFTYGRIYESLENWGLFVPKHAYLLPTLLFAWGYCLYFISRPKRDFRTTTTVLNVIAIVLVALNLANIFIYQVTKPKLTPGQAPVAKSAVTPSPGSGQPLPDIYFIILDEYAHPDTMKKYYGYDNSQFIKSLQDKGFFVDNNARSHSHITPEAIGQALNMEYISYADPWTEPAYQRYACSRVAEFLKARGYKYIYFGNELDEGRWEGYMKDNADLYFNYYQAAASPWISEFQRILWNTTMLKPVDSYLYASQYDACYRRAVTGTLEGLKQMPKLPGPKFVFAHVYSPHLPFVFGPQGEHVEPVNWRNGKDPQFYLGQYIFISTQVESVASTILEKSKSPPVIIIQSDHGLRPHAGGQGLDSILKNGRDEWRKILNAYYLPGECKNRLYDSISPVNSFRLIFNCYFGESYEYLED